MYFEASSHQAFTGPRSDELEQSVEFFNCKDNFRFTVGSNYPTNASQEFSAIISSRQEILARQAIPEINSHAIHVRQATPGFSQVVLKRQATPGLRTTSNYRRQAIPGCKAIPVPEEPSVASSQLYQISKSREANVSFLPIAAALSERMANSETILPIFSETNMPSIGKLREVSCLPHAKFPPAAVSCPPGSSLARKRVIRNPISKERKPVRNVPLAKLPTSQNYCPEGSRPSPLPPADEKSYKLKKQRSTPFHTLNVCTRTGYRPAISRIPLSCATCGKPLSRASESAKLTKLDASLCVSIDLLPQIAAESLKAKTGVSSILSISSNGSSLTPQSKQPPSGKKEVGAKPVKAS